MPAILYAVHLSDGILNWQWVVAGFVIMAICLAVAIYRIPQDMIPRLGVLTAVFFVASQARVPLWPTSVHPILNGLTGILLGHRCIIAIAVGLAMQAFLLGHGGYYAIGVNFLVMMVPALFAAVIYRVLPIRGGALSSFLLGSGTAILTVVLNSLVLYFWTEGDWAVVARTSLLMHLPIIALEGIVVAWALRVLANSRPEWLGLPVNQPSGNTSANGTSH